MEQSHVGRTIGQHVPHGVLIVNKPDGWTSHDVVMRIRSVLGIQKVGHAGTLDPHATGVLPMLIGKGTKIAQYLLDWDKEYAAVLQLGKTTDTQDAWGAVLEERSCQSLSEDDVRSAFIDFQGPIQQVPPMYSAVKIGGQPLYKKARKGQTVERQAKTVVIHELEIQQVAIPEVSFRVTCSKGTYVRTLCHDIGNRLGVGGHLNWLERRRVGPLHIHQAVDIESLTDASQLNGAWRSLDDVLGEFPSVAVNGDDARKVLHGNAIPWNRTEWRGDASGVPTTGEARRVRVKSKDGALLALGKGPSLQAGQSGPMLVLDTVLG
jgi:tRNA pseudouridine55 synthase